MGFDLKVLKVGSTVVVRETIRVRGQSAGKGKGKAKGGNGLVWFDCSLGWKKPSNSEGLNPDMSVCVEFVQKIVEIGRLFLHPLFGSSLAPTYEGLGLPVMMIRSVMRSVMR